MTLRVGMIGEGPTDALVVEQLVGIITAREIILDVLQPEDLSGTEGLGTYGPIGTGWKGLRRWCQKVAESPGFLTLINAEPKYDLFIIQIDADVARDAEISCAKPCPPASATASALEKVVLEWLGVDEVTSPAVILIPADNLEAWFLAFLSDDEKYEPLECILKPDNIIKRKPFKIDKSKRSYRAKVLPELEENWDKIKSKCTQAAKFESDILAVLET